MLCQSFLFFIIKVLLFDITKYKLKRC